MNILYYIAVKLHTVYIKYITESFLLLCSSHSKKKIFFFFGLLGKYLNIVIRFFDILCYLNRYNIVRGDFNNFSNDNYSTYNYY